MSTITDKKRKVVWKKKTLSIFYIFLIQVIKIQILYKNYFDILIILIMTSLVWPSVWPGQTIKPITHLFFGSLSVPVFKIMPKSKFYFKIVFLLQLFLSLMSSVLYLLLPSCFVFSLSLSSSSILLYPLYLSSSLS